MTDKLRNKKEIQKKIREFSQTPKWKDFLTFFVFVVLAFIFWIIQYFQQRFEVEVSVPISYTEVPADIVLSDSIPEKISLKIQDKGTTLLSYYTTKKPQPIEISLKDISPQKRTYIVNQITINHLLQERLNSSSEIKSVSLDKIEVGYSPLQQKEVPVKLNGMLLPASGYVISDSITIDPRTVIAYGDSNRIDTLTYILTTPIENREINRNLDLSLDLQVPPNIRLSKNKAHLTLQVEEYTEKMIEVPVICSHLPSDRIIRFFPSTVEVYVQIGLSHYAEMDSSKVKIDLDYRKLLEGSSTSYYLELTEFPPEVLNYRIVPEIVEFLVEQVN